MDEVEDETALPTTEYKVLDKTFASYAEFNNWKKTDLGFKIKQCHRSRQSFNDGPKWIHYKCNSCDSSACSVEMQVEYCRVQEDSDEQHIEVKKRGTHGLMDKKHSRGLPSNMETLATYYLQQGEQPNEALRLVLEDMQRDKQIDDKPVASRLKQFQNLKARLSKRQPGTTKTALNMLSMEELRSFTTDLVSKGRDPSYFGTLGNIYLLFAFSKIYFSLINFVLLRAW